MEHSDQHPAFCTQQVTCKVKMQSSVRVVVSLVLLSSAFASYHSSTKLRRDGVLNLYPFPRVGRASRNTWQVPLNDFFLEYDPVEKRQLYAFPRVGRSDVSVLREPLHREFQPAPDRRTADSPGMWFGPRLGRSFKSDDDDITMNENIDHSDPELIEEREKRQIKPM